MHIEQPDFTFSNDIFKWYLTDIRRTAISAFRSVISQNDDMSGFYSDRFVGKEAAILTLMCVGFVKGFSVSVYGRVFDFDDITGQADDAFDDFAAGFCLDGDDVAVLIVIIELIDNADVSVHIGWLHGAADDVDGFEDASE